MSAILPRVRRMERRDLARVAEVDTAAWVKKNYLARQLGLSEADVRHIHERMRVTPELLGKQMERFPDGQLIFDQLGSVLAHLATTVRRVRSLSDLPRSYDEATAERTFSNHFPIAGLNGDLGMLLCTSITVDPIQGEMQHALVLLNAGIRFAEELGLVAAPFTAPRGFGRFLRRNKEVTIEQYLEMTSVDTEVDLDEYRRYLSRLNEKRIVRETYGRLLEPLDEQQLRKELEKEAGLEAFRSFKRENNGWFKETYGREMTVVDYIRLTMRRHEDGVLSMHIQNGADFIYEDGRIVGILPGSRPEDPTCAGVNIVMTYGAHPLLGIYPKYRFK